MYHFTCRVQKERYDFIYSTSLYHCLQIIGYTVCGFFGIEECILKKKDVKIHHCCRKYIYILTLYISI